MVKNDAFDNSNKSLQRKGDKCIQNKEMVHLDRVNIKDRMEILFVTGLDLD